MTVKEKLALVAVKLSQILGEDPKAAPAEDVPTEPKEYSLKTGEKIKIDKLEEGGKAETIATDGSSTPMPAGEYELVDGTMITVDESGVITAVAAKAEEMPAAEDVAMREQLNALEQSFNEQKAELQKENEALKKAVADMQTAFNSFKSQTAELLKESVGAMQAFMEAPAAGPLDEPKNIYQEMSEDRTRKIDNYLALMREVSQ